MIRRSTNFDGRKFRYDGRDVDFSRIWGGVCVHGPCAVAVGEEHFGATPYYYVVAEVTAANLAELMDDLRVLSPALPVTRWVGDLRPEHDDFVRTSNKKAFREGVAGVTIHRETIDHRHIDVGIGAIFSLLRPRKALHFFDLSSVAAELQAVQDAQVPPHDHPMVTALAHAVSGMLRYGADSYRAEDLVPACYED